MNHPYVYKLIHKDTKQFYIGYREANILPAKEDLGFKYKSSSKEVDKLGFNNFDIEIIKEFDDSDRKSAGNEAYIFENKLIKSHMEESLCLNKFYNSETSRKFKTVSHSASTREKIGKSQIGKVMSVESRIKMSLSAKGRKASDETRSNISKAKRGLVLSNLARSNISSGKMGHTVSEETRLKLRLYNLGREASKETKSKMSKASLVHRQNSLLEFELISPTGEIYTGTNISNFCKQHNLKVPSISQICKGTLKKYKGWTGKYKE